MTVGGAPGFAIVFMTGGVFLTVTFFVAAALIVVGHFKPSRRLQRAGWIALAIWALPAAAWTYYLQILIEQDQYRSLGKPEVLYGIPLPAGAQVSFRRWARRVQWATFNAPQNIEGVDYITRVDFCGKRVCSGILARDQAIQGLPCRAHTEVHFSETTGELTEYTLARPFVRQGVTWPAGTVVVAGAYPSYELPEGADPVPVAGLLVHSGLIVQFSADGHIREIHRNQSRANADTRLQVGDILLKSDQYRFQPDGAIGGGVLARDAVIDGKPMKTGDAVVLRQPQSP